MSESVEAQVPQDAGYTIPVSLERSVLNMKLDLSTGDIRIPAFPIKSILMVVGGLGAMVWVGVTTSVVTDASVWLQVLYYLFFSVVVLYLATFDRAGDMRLEQVLTLFTYLPAASRRLVTRGNVPAKQFADFLFMDVSEGEPVSEDGVIYFKDGRVGRSYLVVGSASLLLFLKDKQAILQNVNSFWQAADSEDEYLMLTTKEPQRVHHQIAHLEELSRNLVHDEPDLRDLLDEEYAIQRDFVGKRFKSIHQYLVLMAPNIESLRSAEDSLMSVAADPSDSFLKACIPLSRQEFVESFSALYRGRSY